MQNFVVTRLPSSRARSMRLGQAREHGFSLIVSLMMLIVIIILGVSASQMAINEERGARNDRDRQLAFQAAEAALKDAEQEIYGSSAPLCTLPGQQKRGRMRLGTFTCFNETNYFGYEANCSGPPNAGLCTNNPAAPAYLDLTKVNFYKDASRASGANYHTVAYGTFTNRTFGSQATLGSNQPVSIYPPRYIIEAVPKNTSVDTTTLPGSGAGQGGALMFRVTAMGFGASPTSQVVLQAVISTQD